MLKLSADCCYLGWPAGSLDIILKGVHQSLVLIGQAVSEGRFLNIFPIGPIGQAVSEEKIFKTFFL